MSIKMKKSGLVIAFSLIALMLTAVLAGCQQDIFDIVTPSTKVDGNAKTGGSGGYTAAKAPRIEIYWDGDETVNRAGQVLSWAYDKYAESNPELMRRVSGRVFNGPADSGYLEWTITPPQAIIGGMLRSSSFSNVLSDLLPIYRTAPLANGSSFELFGGTTPGFARISVWNTTKDGVRGTINAYIDVSATGLFLRPLSVYVGETITVDELGFVKVNAGRPAPVWSVRGGNAAVSIAYPGYIQNGGYSNARLNITGLYPGATTYFARAKQGGTLRYDSDNNVVKDMYGDAIYDGEETVDTEGPLQVIPKTSWYVGPGARGTYGFRKTDIVTLAKSLSNMRSIYIKANNAWPGKGSDTEEHGVILLTGNETANFTFNGTDFPANIDLVNESPQTQRTFAGIVRVGNNKTLTLSEIKTTGVMEITSGAEVKMLSPQTEINGNVYVYGTLTMQDGKLSGSTIRVYNLGTLTIAAGQVSGGTVKVENGAFLTMNGGALNSLQTTVDSGGKLTVNAGSVNGKVDVSGTFAMNGGTLTGTSSINVHIGGKLTINQGTVITTGTSTNSAKVFRNGVALDNTTTPQWPPTSWPFTLEP
ncbi:hypothetical protein FACS189476_11960 [Spirochaetia bacterium]|nr:hypothetical protein FACS189476_11960 [Spirochaetia bacterium]